MKKSPPKAETVTIQPSLPDTKQVKEDILGQFTDTELEAEMKRRREERERKLREAHQARYSYGKGLLDDPNSRAIVLKVIDVLHPDHDRTSCSDTNLDNGWGSNGIDSHPRCIRCAILELFQQNALGEIPYGLNTRIEISSS